MAKADATPIPLRGGDNIAGRYEIVRELGRGGMGVVYLCHDRVTKDRVAVKCVFLDRSRTVANEAIWFQQEARALAALDHPAIVRARDFGTLPDGSPYLVMDALHGRSIHVWKYLTKIPWSVIWSFVDQVLSGLAHAHARGIIHGDMKPSNVVIDPRLGVEEPRAYILDLGLAWLLSDHVDPRLEESAMASPTMPFGLGTPGWMAPEQIRRAAPHIGPSTDLYALGSIVYELLAGKEVFTGSSTEILRAHRDGVVPDLALPEGVPDGVAAWVQKCLAKRPWHRYRLAADARAAWAAFKPTEPILWVAPNVRIGDEAQDPALLSLKPATTNAPSGASLAPGILSLRPSPLVGRAREKGQLAEIAAELAAGKPPKQRLIVLRGEAGVGKSKLAEWLFEAMHESATMTPLRARYRKMPGPLDGMRGAIVTHYNLRGVSRDVIEQALLNEWEIENDDEQGRTWVAAAAAWIRPLTPDEEAKVGPSGKRFFLDKSELRWVVIRHILERIGGIGRPILLWVDDLHLGSQNAFAGLAQIHREAHTLPLLLVCTVRDEALAADGVAAANLEELKRVYPTTELALARLDETETRTLLRSALPLSDDAEATALSRSQGNPLFALQLVHAWASGGHLQLHGDVYRVPEEALHRRVKTTAELWDERLEALAPSLRPAAYAASALGEVGSIDGMTRLLTKLGVDAAAALRALQEAQILMLEGGDRLRWPHGLLQEHMFARLSASPESPKIFRLAAEALASHPEAGTRGVVRQRVQNLILAGDDLAASTLMLDFVSRAWRRVRDVTAIKGDLLMLEGHVQGGKAAEFLRWRAETERHLGNLSEARTLAEEARRRFHDLGAERDEAHCLRLLAHIASDQGVPALGRIEAVLAHDKFDSLGDEMGKAQCELLLGEIKYLLGDHAEARTNLMNAARVLTKHEDNLGLAQVFILQSFVEQAVGRLDRARDLLMSARREFDAIGYQLGLAQVDIALAHIEHRAGELETAYKRAESTRLRFRDMDNPRGEAACDRLAAMASLDRDDLQTAFHHALAAYSVYDQRLADAWGRVEGAVLLAQVALAERSFDRAREHLSVASSISIDEAEPTQHRYMTEIWLLLEANRADDTLDIIQAARNAFPDPRRTGDHTPQLLKRLARRAIGTLAENPLVEWIHFLESVPSVTTPVPPSPSSKH